MGAEAHIGSIEDVETLRKGAAGADGAIHTTFFHQISHMRVSTRLGVILGGSPSGIVYRFMKAAVEADKRAIETLGRALIGPDRALVSAFPTMALRLGRLATEQEAPEPHSPGGGRGPSEAAALALTSIGIRSSVVRLPPVVHDLKKQGLVTMMIAVAKKKGVSAFVEDGGNRWGAVHVLDTARLFRLALERGPAGARHHAIAEEGIPGRKLAEVIGRGLNVPPVSKSSQEATKLFTWLAPFIAADNPVSSKLTQERMGWRPTQPSLMSDLEKIEA